jgi:hypothetical protein
MGTKKPTAKGVDYENMAFWQAPDRPPIVRSRSDVLDDIEWQRTFAVEHPKRAADAAVAIAKLEQELKELDASNPPPAAEDNQEDYDLG